MADIQPIASLGTVAEPYRVFLVDIWGVVHNGERAFEAAGTALVGLRRAGKAVVLISNAPRPSWVIPDQLARLGVAADSYDAIVTSGDAARAIILGWTLEGRKRLHHIGPARDLALFEGLDIDLVPLDAASSVVCTGLVDDETEAPDDYDTVLREVAELGLPFLCANPDIVVQRGDRLIYCAGALAERFEAMGGQAIYPGKPHPAIYELALRRAGEVLGAQVDKAAVLAIGDGLKTDILGAERFGIASLFIAHGIHGGDLARGGKVDIEAVRRACSVEGLHPIGVMSALAP
jgi:HAD superfamily hydrolase (TIGR01459 family)